MKVHHSSCIRCGSILDAPRVNPRTGMVARKCCDCERWQPLALAKSEMSRPAAASPRP